MILECSFYKEKFGQPVSVFKVAESKSLIAREEFRGEVTWYTVDKDFELECPLRSDIVLSIERKYIEVVGEGGKVVNPTWRGDEYAG